MNIIVNVTPIQTLPSSSLRPKFIAAFVSGLPIIYIILNKSNLIVNVLTLCLIKSFTLLSTCCPSRLDTELHACGARHALHYRHALCATTYRLISCFKVGRPHQKKPHPPDLESGTKVLKRFLE